MVPITKLFKTRRSQSEKEQHAAERKLFKTIISKLYEPQLLLKNPNMIHIALKTFHPDTSETMLMFVC